MVPRLLPATALLWAVMPRFMSGIHDFLVPKTWMAGTSPAMAMKSNTASLIVMPGFMPGIHVRGYSAKQDMGGREKPGHDELRGGTTHSASCAGLTRASMMRCAMHKQY
jgi:hypothetical protein